MRQGSYCETDFDVHVNCSLLLGAVKTKQPLSGFQAGSATTMTMN